MAYTTLTTVNAGDDIAVDWGNAVKADIEYLIAGLKVAKTDYLGSADVTITGTSFANTDATNHAVSATLTGGFAVVVASFRALESNTASQYGEFDILDDVSAARAGNATHGRVMLGQSKTFQGNIIGVFTSLTAATHKFTLQARVTGGGASLTLYNNGELVSLYVYYY